MMEAVTYRALELGDVPATCAMHQKAEVFDEVPRMLEVDELEEELTGTHVEIGTDTLGAFAGDAIVGYAYTYHLPSEVKEERCYVFGIVDPDHRDRGIGTELLEWGVDRATTQLQSSDRSIPRFIRVEAPDGVTGAHDLFSDLGFAPVRYNEELLRPLADLPPVSTVEGVAIRPWPTDRDEEIRREKNDAFTDHWGSTPTGTDGWKQMVHGFGARPDLSFVAIDTASGDIIGHCLNHRYPADDTLLGRSDGWINSLGTLRAWRGRGVATAMILRTLHTFAAAGLTHASIGVDSQNPTGAAELYRGLGFELAHRAVTHQIEVGLAARNR